MIALIPDIGCWHMKQLGQSFRSQPRDTLGYFLPYTFMRCATSFCIGHAAVSIAITSAASLFSTVCPFSGQNLRPRIPPHNHNNWSVVVFIQKKYTRRNPGGC
jgi:hypothetical protein